MRNLGKQNDFWLFFDIFQKKISGSIAEIFEKFQMIS